MNNERIFLDNAAWGIPSEQVLNCAEQFTSMFRDPGKTTRDITLSMRSWMVEARKAVGKLINCDPSEVALIESTTHALSLVGNMLPLGEGDNVLVCDLEYLASTLCWKRRQEELNFEIREVRTDNNTISAEDFEKCMDRKTKAILLASVQEINGYRADVKSIAALAKKHGCYIIIDGIQEVGAMRVDVKALGVDIYCAGGKKWIRNPYGVGFMYVREDRIPELKPYGYGYYNVQIPSKYDVYTSYLEDPNRSPFDPTPIIENATKYENGGFANYLGALGLTAAIQVLLDEGTDRIEEKIIYLNRKLTHGLAELGIDTCSSKDSKHMSSTISFNFGIENFCVDRERALVKYLRERNIFVSLRCCTGTGGVRVSFHYYTPEAYIDTFLGAMKEYLTKSNH